MKTIALILIFAASNVVAQVIPLVPFQETTK